MSKIIKPKDAEIVQMFNQMLGAGDSINMPICYKKYEELREAAKTIIKTIKIISEFALLRKNEEFLHIVNELETYVVNSNKIIDELWVINFDEYKPDFSGLDSEQKTSFSTLYDKIKSCEFSTQVMMTLNNLIPYKAFISDKDNLDHKFILNIPGVEYCPIVFTSLNLKRLFTVIETDSDIIASVKTQMIQVLMLFINKLYIKLYEYYKTISSPDIDVKEFAQIIVNNLAEVKKKIPRCERAFRKIEESVELLENNFGKYYRDFVETKNQTIFMENFVLDVAHNTKADMQTVREFKTIISYYRKVAHSQIKNPQIKMLFDKVQENFSKLDKYANINKFDGTKDDADDELPDEEAEPEEPTEEMKARIENDKKSVDDLIKDMNL